jgi:hypothetical protein
MKVIAGRVGLKEGVIWDTLGPGVDGMGIIGPLD